jgi:hypothetical protein
MISRYDVRPSSLSVRLAAAAVGIVLLAAPAAPALSAQPGATAAGIAGPSALQPSGQPFELVGRIVSVDYADNVVVVRAHGDRISIAITPTTSIMRAGQPGGMSDLRQGVRIHVTGEQRDGVKTADGIEIIK